MEIASAGSRPVTDEAAARPGRAAWPHAAGLVAIALFALVDPPWTGELPTLVFALNLAFGGIGAFVVAVVTVRAFLRRGDVGLLLLSAGALVWCLVSSLNVLLASLAGGYDVNVAITVYNAGVWVAALCHMAGIATDLRFGPVVRVRLPWAVAVWAAAAGAVAIFAWLATTHALPPFYVAGHGGTTERQFVILSAAAMFAMCGVLLWTGSPSRSRFHRWYALALALLAEGLLAVALIAVPGDALNWTGRVLQYAGAVYMLVAVLGPLDWRAPGASMADGGTRARTRMWPAFTVALVLAAATLGLSFLPALVARAPFLLFFPAVILAGLYAGARAGVLATLLSAFTVAWYWLGPPSSLAVGGAEDLVALAFFVVSGLLLSFVGEVLLDAQRGRIVAEAEAERRREALSRERQFQAMADAMPQLAWMAASDGSIVWLNRRWHDYTGLHGDVALRDWPTLLDPAEADDVLREWRASLANGTPFERVVALKGLDGGFRPFLTRTAAVRDDAGRILRWFGTMTDIAERERAERAVRDKARFARHVLDNLFVFVGVLDLDGTLLEANRAPVEAAGLVPADVIGRKFWDCYWWTHDDAVRARLIEAHREACGGRAVRYDVPVRVRGGALIWIDFQLAPLRDDDGVVTHLIPSGADVTARREAEAALRASESRLRATFDNAALGIAQVALDGRFLLVNDTLCRIVGYEPQALYGMRFGDITHPDDLDRDWAEAKRLLAGEIASYRMEKRYLRGDGRTVWVELTGSVVRDAAGAPQYFVAGVVDIDARRTAQARLRDSEERFRKVFENAPTGIAIADLDGRLVLANPAYCAMLGYPHEALMALTFMQLVHPEDRAHNLGLAQQLRDGALPFFEIENRFVARDGHPVWVHKFVTLLRGEDGTPANLVALVTDVGERRRAETELREADRRKDEFLATLAHELRNPLAPLATGLAVLQMAGPEAARRAEVVAAMGRQVAQLTRLVDDLLEVSRITTGKLQLRLAPVRLDDAVRAALESTAPDIARRGHDLRVDLGDAPLVVQGDAARLAQVAANLIGNAAKYTPAGGRIDVTLRAEGDDAVLQVTDDGVGIDPAQLDAIFGLFAQAHPAHLQHEGGLGIGLHLVQRLVGMHGGRIRASSAGAGQGSRFEVRLPRVSAPAADDPARDASPAGALRVLVVDDNVDAAHSMAMLLSLHGHAVEEAHDGQAALIAAERQRPDVVLLDLGMPKLDGFGVARALRATPWGHAVRLVALSGWGQDEDKRRTAAAGFDDHLTKPASPEDLARALQRRVSAR